ncbi:olfactory receptor 10AG1-like [Myripristis murdjan]|uniref:olfactory receptor 10AG1-like n=1 Tax=Myripristis murdjan TaxID=586833 RepID=UPI0011761614|nr:olfactory receptor 10AG1-like [Myripristis murdjan]
MEDEFNVTYITLGGHVEVHKYRYLYFVIMFTVYLLIICSNSIILCLICIHKSLHEPMYIFIAALLLNSIFFSTAIYPKLLMDFLSEKQTISYPLCLFQFFLYYCLGGADFLLLSAMAYDRYVSICKPLQYSTIMTTKTIIIFLVLAWLLPAAELSGSVLIAYNDNKKLCKFVLNRIFCNNAITKLGCVTSVVNYIYGIIIMMNIALVPILFIVFTYTKILVITYRSSADAKKKAAQTCVPHLLVLISFSTLCVFDVISNRMESAMPKSVQLIMTLQCLYIILYSTQSYMG